MKTYLFLALAALLIAAAACNKKMRSNDASNDAQQPVFPNAEAAISQAKQDLQAVLSATQGSFGVSAEQLANAQPMGQIRQRTLNFERMLSLDSISSFAGLQAEDEPMLVPFGSNNQVVTNVEIAQNSGNWKVLSLARSEHTSDLNMLPEEIKSNKFDKVTVYFVPNIEAKVIVTELNGVEQCYTSYKGHSAREPMPAAALYKQLRADAQEFQRKFGDRLKKGRALR